MTHKSTQSPVALIIRDVAGYFRSTVKRLENLFAEIGLRFSGHENLDNYADLVAGGDWTPALAAAVATGKNVYIPGNGTIRQLSTLGVGGIAFAADGQTIWGDGALSALQTTVMLSLIFNANGRSRCGIRSLRLIGPGTLPASPGIASSYTQSGFCATTASTDCFVRQCTFSGWAGGAVFMQNAAGFDATGNKFHGAMTMPLATDNFGAADITLWGSSVDCLVESNQSDSGASFGVILQTVAGAAQTARRNKIRGNRITGAKNYGILVYNQSNGIPPVVNNIYDTEVTGNTIDTVYGFYNNPASGLKDYGAGIYVLSSENTTVAGNIVRNTCVNTAGATLTPAGIAVNATSKSKVYGNIVQTSAWYGIFVTDGLQLGAGVSPSSASFSPDGYTTVTNNNVSDTQKHGIYVKDKHKVKVSGNTVNNVIAASNSAIVFEASAAVYPTLRDISCADNSMCGFQTAGILCGLTVGAVISGNQINGVYNGVATGGTGIFAETTDGSITDNNIRAITAGSGRGIDIRSTGANTNFSGNTITGCTTGVLCGGSLKWGDNALYGNTTQQSGTYTWWTSAAFTPTAALGAGLSSSTTVAVTGAVLGDFVIASFSRDLLGGSPSAYVSAAGVVTYRIRNDTAGAITIGAGTLKVKVIPQQ